VKKVPLPRRRIRQVPSWRFQPQARAPVGLSQRQLAPAWGGLPQGYRRRSLLGRWHPSWSSGTCARCRLSIGRRCTCLCRACPRTCSTCPSSAGAWQWLRQQWFEDAEANPTRTSRQASPHPHRTSRPASHCCLLLHSITSARGQGRNPRCPVRVQLREESICVCPLSVQSQGGLNRVLLACAFPLMSAGRRACGGSGSSWHRMRVRLTPAKGMSSTSAGVSPGPRKRKEQLVGASGRTPTT